MFTIGKGREGREGNMGTTDINNNSIYMVKVKGILEDRDGYRSRLIYLIDIF